MIETVLSSSSDSSPIPLTPLVPLPSYSSYTPSPSYAALVNDHRAVLSLIELLLTKSGLSQAELARRMGVKPVTVNHYFRLRRRPSLMWMLRFIEAVGGKLLVELPSRPMQANGTR